MSGRTSRRERLRARMPTGSRLPVVAGLFAAGVAVSWLGVTHLAYTTGLAGTSGHLEVASCTWSTTGGHRYPHCHGVFRSNDGTVVRPDATVDHRLTVGDTVAVRRTASGSYELTGPGAVSGWLAVCLFGLAVLVLGATVASAEGGSSDLSRKLLLLLGALFAAMLVSALVGGVVGVAGAL
ncbi:hypothetical protein [Streptomyces aureus]|uniref:hypothetical protein n=1 Tax=Streptomyces aureus TaxID=193461 RepID=UPI0036A4B505